MGKWGLEPGGLDLSSPQARSRGGGRECQFEAVEVEES
jgi:hypothetical protein